MKRAGYILLIAMFASRLFAQQGNPVAKGNPETSDMNNPPNAESLVPAPAWPSSKKRSTTLQGATVSIKEMRISGRAEKEFKLAKRYFLSGKFSDSAERLRSVIRIDPQLPLAHYSLGLCHARLNEYEKASVEFQTASDLDHGFLPSWIGLAGSLQIRGQYPQAEAAARQAYDIDPTNPVARYLLARILVLEGHDAPEAIELLRKSRPEFPAAHLLLASVFLRRNSREEAVVELNEYLHQPRAPQKEQVAYMLERLTKLPGPFPAVPR